MCSVNARHRTAPQRTTTGVNKTYTLKVKSNALNEVQKIDRGSAVPKFLKWAKLQTTVITDIIRETVSEPAKTISDHGIELRILSAIGPISKT